MELFLRGSESLLLCTFSMKIYKLAVIVRSQTSLLAILRPEIEIGHPRRPICLAAPEVRAGYHRPAAPSPAKYLQ